MGTRGRPSEPTGSSFAVDERLVMPETRFEVIDGKVVHVSPSDQPRGSRHSKLSALLEAYAGAGYDAASDMLTRTSDTGDMAPDGSVYPSAPDPVTGGRMLEELAFEVVATETLAAAGKKAARLVERGVRRVFALDVERRRALEWSRRTENGEMLRTDGAIEDRALALPLPLQDLVVAAKADDAVARALLAKQNPVLVAALTEARVEGREHGRAEGRAEGKAEAIVAFLTARGLTVSTADARALRAAGDPALLNRWLAKAATCRTVAELLRPEASSSRDSVRKNKPKR